MRRSCRGGVAPFIRSACGMPVAKQLAAEAKVLRLEEEVKLEWDMRLMQAVHMEALGCQREQTGPAAGLSGLVCSPGGAEADPSLNPGRGSAPRMER